MAVSMAWLGLTVPARADELEPVDRVAAVVGAEIITMTELGDASKMMPNVPLEDILERLIEEKLFEIEARRQGIEISDGEVDAAVETHVAKFDITVKEFEDMLKEEGMSMEQFREKIRNELKKIKFVKSFIRGDVEVSEEEMINFYRRHPDEFRGEETVHIARIFLPFSLEADEVEIQKVMDLANDIISKVKAGQSFADLARQYSNASNAAEGGDLDWVSTEGLMPAYKTAIDNLQPGNVSDIIELENGCHIIYLYERKSAEMISYEAVKEQIYQVVYSQKIAEEIDRIITKLKQEIPIERKLE